MNPFTTTPYADSMGTADGAAHRVAREGNDGGRPDRRPRPSLSFGIAFGLTPNPDDPNPLPWPAAVSFLVTVVGLKQAALRALALSSNRELVRWADGSVEEFIEGWCGTKTNLGPGRWPWPGPNPWTPALATQLGLVADSLAFP